LLGADRGKSSRIHRDLDALQVALESVVPCVRRQSWHTVPAQLQERLTRARAGVGLRRLGGRTGRRPELC
jgi:hypothetical protein